MRRALCLFTVALLAACDAPTPTEAPVLDAVAAPIALSVTPSTPSPFLVDNGDGTATLTFQPGPELGKDAWAGVAGGQYQNGGEATLMYNWNSSCNAFRTDALLEFDLTDLPADVLSVRLETFYVVVRGYMWSQQTPAYVSLYRVTSPWEEDVVTHPDPLRGPRLASQTLNLPARGEQIWDPGNEGGWCRYGPCAHNRTFRDWLSWELTDLYRGWVDGSVPNYGVAIHRDNRWCENANSMWVVASDYPGESGPYHLVGGGEQLRPKLVITFPYTPEEENEVPTASIVAPSSVDEGGFITFTADASDPDGDDLTYLWTFDDGFMSTDPEVTRGYADDGYHSVTLLVDDGNDGVATADATFDVLNVAPSVMVGPDAELLTGEAFTGSGSFTDPGADSWTVAMDYGDGSGGPVPFWDGAFDYGTMYGSAGVYTVVASVTDDDGGSGSAELTVTVLTAEDFLDRLIAHVGGAGYARGLTNSLVKKLENARKSLDRGNDRAAVNQLGAFANELRALVRNGRVDDEHAEVWMAMLNRILAVLAG